MRDEFLGVRLQFSDRVLIEQAARVDGLTLSEFARRELRRASRQRLNPASRPGFQDQAVEKVGAP